MKKVIGITFRVILWLLAGILVLAIAILLLVQVPAVQDFGRKKTVNYLEKKLQTEVAVGNLRLGLPNTILLEDVYLEDRQQDTLLSAGKLFADISLLRLLSNEVKVNEVSVEKFYARIHLRADSSFNFDFITQAFDTGTTTPEPEDSTAAPMAVSLGEFTFNDIRLDYIDETMPADISVSLGHLYTLVNRSDIEDMRFGADNTRSSNLFLSYKDAAAGMEVLTRLGSLDLSALDIDLLHQQVNLGTARLDSSLALVAFTASDTGDPAAMPATDTSASGTDPGWTASVKQLLVNNTGFRFDDHNAPQQPEGMDYMHMQVNDFHADLRDLNYSPEQINGSLKAASFREKSGFLLKTLRTDFVYTDTGAAMDKLYLETGGSVLQEHIRISYPSLELIAEDPAALSIDARLSSCRLSYADMLLLAPFLVEYEPFKSTRNGVIGIDGIARGRVDDLYIEELEVSTLEKTYLAAEAHMKGLPDMDKAWFDVRLQELSSGRGDLIRLAGADMIPGSVSLPAGLSMEGSFRGNIDRFGSSAVLRSSYGNISLEGTMAPGTGEGREQYTAKLQVDDFDVGRLLKQEDTLGRVSLEAQLSGSGTTPETADAQLEGRIHSAVYNGYTYRDLALNGSIRNERVIAAANMNDPNLRFDLTADANLSGSYPSVKMDLQLDTLDLQALNLYEEKLQLGLKVAADLPVADPDSLNGSVFINDLSLDLDSGAYRMDTIAFLATATDTLQAMSLSSDFIQASLSGNFTIGGLAPAMMAHIDRYFQTGISDSLQAASGTGQTAGDEASVQTAPAREEAADSVQHINLTARIAHPPLLREMLPELSRLDTICIDARFDNRDETLELNAIAPAIRYGSNEIDSVLATVSTADTSIDYKFGVKRIYNPAVQVLNTSLAGQLAGNRASIELLTRDPGMKPHYRIAGTLAALDNAYQFRFDPGQLLLDYEEWTAGENNLFHYSDSGFYAEQIRLSNGEQLLLIDSEESRPGAPLGISLKDFEISTLTRIAQQDSLAIDGRINGDALISNLDSNMVFVSDLLVNDFSFNRDTVGDITLKMNNEQENNYSVDVSVESDKNRANLAGSYYPEPVDGNSFDLALDIISLDMETIAAFSLGQLRDASGQLKGSFNISGTTEAPNVTGGLVFQKAGFTPTYINSPLFLEDEMIALTPQGIVFDQFTVLDSLKNRAVLDGTIYTSDFTSYRFDLDLTTRNFQAVNTAPGDNELFYGQLFLDSDVSIEGSMDNPAVDAYLRVNEKTDLSMILPADEPGVQEREGVVEFVDMDAPADSLQTDTLKAESGISGLELSADLEIDEEAQFTVVVDPVNGDNLRIKGSGALSTSMDPNGVITLTGRYEIAEGAYELSFNMLRRRFEISQGSYITWVGDPFSADVDITAVYIAETQPLELVQDQLTNMSQTERNRFKQTLPFQVMLQMEGELMKPEISFNIDLPEKEQDAHGGLVYSRLQQLQLAESDLNKQVFALLVLNRFVAENPLESVGGTSVSSMARQSVSKLLSEQLNRLAGDLIAGVDLNFDLESTEDYSTGQKVDRTDLNVGLSKSLFNDRITVNVGSSFGLEGQETRGKASSIAGDVSVDYQLSRDGRYRLRAYRQNEYEGVIEGQIIETGLSFIISMDYDEFKELFEKQVPRDEQL